MYIHIYHHTAYMCAAAAAKLLQSCPTLCDPRDSSPPRSAVPGILQARTLGRVAISFSNAGKWKVKVKSLSRVRLLTTPWTAAHQAPPSMGFSRQEYWSGVPLPSQPDFIVSPLVFLSILPTMLKTPTTGTRVSNVLWMKWWLIWLCWDETKKYLSQEEKWSR